MKLYRGYHEELYKNLIYLQLIRRRRGQTFTKDGEQIGDQHKTRLGLPTKPKDALLFVARGCPRPGSEPGLSQVSRPIR